MVTTHMDLGAICCMLFIIMVKRVIGSLRMGRWAMVNMIGTVHVKGEVWEGLTF